ncbi:MAG: T9SS type A sorting domain-containing protein [candidate division Zixibacteria bacterium]|nr:T9SS type A sorting domain-containing protein [candidate division Zixibacteria bacterium]
MKKMLTILAILIFSASIPVSARIIHVPGDFATIQAGIDDTQIGDTVKVAPNTYNENVVIDQAISLIGQDRDQTTIWGIAPGDVVIIDSDDVYVRGFTITNSGPDTTDAGIQIGDRDNCTVELCSFPDNMTGIELYEGSYNTIQRCLFDSNIYGILFWEDIESCEQGNLSNSVLNNVFENSSKCAIMFEHILYHHDANDVIGNRIANCNMGMSMIMSFRNAIVMNEFIDNTSYGVKHGICEGGGGQNEFHHNNFIENNGDSIQAVNGGVGDDLWYCIIQSEGNYWTDYTGPDNNGDGIGDIPFDIEGDPSQDLYPLMEPLEAGILGMITDESFIPIPDVVVTVIGTEIADTSEYHGSYTLTGLGSGNYDISFSHPDYQDTVVLGYATTIDQYTYPNMELRLQTDIDQPDELKPSDFSLMQNSPNPFNASTVIKYNLRNSADVTIYIYDLLGRKIETLVSGYQPAGFNQVVWHSGDRPSGVYFYTLKAGAFVESKKMMLLK